MQVTATVRRCALDDETDGPPMPSPVLPAAGAPHSRPLVFLDRIGRIEVLASG